MPHFKRHLFVVTKNTWVDISAVIDDAVQRQLYQHRQGRRETFRDMQSTDVHGHVSEGVCCGDTLHHPGGDGLERNLRAAGSTQARCVLKFMDTAQSRDCDITCAFFYFICDPCTIHFDDWAQLQKH